MPLLAMLPCADISMLLPGQTEVGQKSRPPGNNGCFSLEGAVLSVLQIVQLPPSSDFAAGVR